MDEKRKKALDAAAILNSPVFADAVESIKGRAVEMWQTAKTTQEREEAWYLQRAVAVVQRELFNTLQCAAVNAGGKVVLESNITLTEELALPEGKKVELDLNGGEIVGTYKTLDELMKAFINDCNELLKTSYTVESSFTWAADLYKIFLDEQYKLKWAPLLQYFIDVETDCSFVYNRVRIDAHFQ
jgi:hypothetical protein